jgi:hypothetical protein
MKVKFKEKTYESYFQTELGRRTNVSFAPDQTDEGLLGFDGAFHLPFGFLPDIFPYVRARRWRHFVGFSASDIDSFGAELNDRLPPFNLNLFAQYKRPEHMERSNATEWSSWGAPYYRYTTEDHQQRLLEKVAEAALGRAAVVYASPAFWSSADLFTYGRDGGIVAHSNIADVARLSGHHRFSYVSAGYHGVGHSEPEPVQSEPFDVILRRGLEQEAMPFTRQIKGLDEMIRTVLKDDRPSYDLWQRARAAVIGGDLADAYPRARGSWIDAIFSVIAFGQAFDMRITALGVDAGEKTDEAA